MVVRVITQYDRLKLIYVSLPKVANTSIKFSLIKAEGLGDFENPHHQRVPAKVIAPGEAMRLGLSSHFSFGVVRNPWDRLVSCWADKCGPNTDLDWTEYGLPPGIAFDQFVDRVCALSDAYSEIHFQSQTRHILHGKCLIPSFVGRFEALADSWGVIESIVRTRTGIELGQLPVKRASEHGSYRDYYTRHLAMKVEDRYQADVNLFGYRY